MAVWSNRGGICRDGLGASGVGAASCACRACKPGTGSGRRTAPVRVDGSALTNFRAGFRGEGFELFGWVRNAFDVNTIELLQVAPGNVGLIAGTPGDERTFSGTIKVSF